MTQELVLTWLPVVCYLGASFFILLFLPLFYCYRATGLADFFENIARIFKLPGPVSTRYFVLGLLYLVMNLTLIYLYCWGLSYNSVQYSAVVAAVSILPLVAAVGVGLIYTWRMGGLD